MKKIISMIIMTSASFGFMAASHATPTEAKATYDAAKQHADAEYKVARATCDSMKGNAKDICQEEAKAAQVKTTAEAEATYKGTPQAHKKARTDIADANYKVAKEKCDDLNGNKKDVCMKEAKAAQTSAIADAKSAQSVTEVRKDARDEKKDANIAVQKEKCDALTGEEKSRCIGAANMGK